MNTRALERLLITGLTVICSYFPASYSYAAIAPNCDNVLATNKTSVSQRMVTLLGKDITKSNRITTVVPAQNNPFVTEDLVWVANDVSPNGHLPTQAPEEIIKVRAHLEQAAIEAERLKKTYELAFISKVEGYCQFANNRQTQFAKIDFDHLEGLTLYSIPALIALVDQSYTMALKRTDGKLTEQTSNKNNSPQSAAAAAGYQGDNVFVKVEQFDGSNVTFSVTNTGSKGLLEPQFNSFTAYRNASGNLTYRPVTLLSVADASGNSLPTIGVAELSAKSGESLSIAPGETRTFVTQLVSEVAPSAQLSLEFPARALNTGSAFSLPFSDSRALSTADIN